MKRKVGIILIILFLVLVAFITNGCSQLSKKQSSVDQAFSELVPDLTLRYAATKDAIALMEELGGEREVTTQGNEAITRFEKALEDEKLDQQLQSARELEIIIGRLNSNASSSPKLSGSQELKDALAEIDERLPALDVREAYNRSIEQFEDSRSSVQNMFSAVVGGYGSSEKIEFWIPANETQDE